MFRSSRGVGGAILAATVLALAPQAARAAAGDAVTVHRGASETVAQPAISGAVQVLRGAPVLPLAHKPVRARLGARPVVAGNRLWLIDAEGGRLTACALRRTSRVGREVVRCFDRKLPRSVSRVAD